MAIKYLILTLVPYPYGGGESFMYQTINWCKNQRYECIWVSFNRNKENTTIKIDNDSIFHTLKGYPSENYFEEIYKTYKPDLIHIQGPIVYLALPFFKKKRIPLLVGFHFWTGVMYPNKEGGWNNSDILSHLDEEVLDPLCQETSENVKMYAASDLINDVIQGLGGKPIENVIYPVSLPQYFAANQNYEKKYITIININKQKGGQLFYEIIKEIKELPFLAFCNEPNNDDLDYKIAKEINGQVLPYTNPSEVYSKTKILLIPTQVDETFSRVAYEAAYNNIPIITTGKGFIRKLLGNNAIIIEDNDPKLWITAIRKLYHNEQEINRISYECKKIINKILISEQETKFIDLCNQLILKSLNKNIMILAPWCDQGLGIQSKLYSKLLRQNNYKVHIFSFLSYFSIDIKDNFQIDPQEWKEYDTIYYSYNTREEITEREIRQFVNSRNIGICLIPEICYKDIFDKIEILNKYGVKVYGIPNIETVRESEINKFNIMEKILCNTRQCYNLLKEKGVENIEYIGHCIPRNNIVIEKPLIKRQINFLHISGYNSITRKQTLAVLKGFSEALQKVDNISLTITFSKNIPNEAFSYKNAKIKIINKPLSHQQILELYSKHHVSIQVGSHEGLGLGFYESLSCLTPVLTLNQAPHNEIIYDERNGWLIPSESFILEDNNESIVQGGYVKSEDICNKIVYLSKNVEDITKIINKIPDENQKWKEEFLIQRLIKAIN